MQFLKTTTQNIKKRKFLERDKLFTCATVKLNCMQIVQNDVKLQLSY